MRTERRNARVIDLIEGDILVKDDENYMVLDGEVTIYADGTIDESDGRLVPFAGNIAELNVFRMEDM